jgi:chromosome segregation ATPase
MISQPENNIPLSESQTLAIEETKTRLLNLESEIAIAQKNQKTLKGENERLVKDNIYQNELLIEVQAKIAPLEAKVSDLDAQIVTKTAEVKVLNDEISTKTTDIEAREAKFVEQKQDITDRLKIVEEKEATVTENTTILNKKMTEFNQKVAKLKEVLPTL